MCFPGKKLIRTINDVFECSQHSQHNVLVESGTTRSPDLEPKIPTGPGSPNLITVTSCVFVTGLAPRRLFHAGVVLPAETLLISISLISSRLRGSFLSTS